MGDGLTLSTNDERRVEVLNRVLAGVLGVAYSAIPDSAGTINGCYATATGQLRIVDPESGQSCRPNEQAIAWTQSGGGLTQVRSDDIVDGEVKSEDIANEAVQSQHIESGAIRRNHIDSGQIATYHIEDGAITANKLTDSYAETVDLAAETLARQFGDASLAADLAAETAAREAGDASLSADIAAFATALAAPGSGKSVHFDNLTDVSVTGGQIANGTITADDIAPGGITTQQQTANSVMGTSFSTTVFSGTPASVVSAMLTLPGLGAGHIVLLTGQVQLSCELCSPSDSTVVTVEVTRDGVPLSSPSSATLAGSQIVTLPVFTLGVGQVAGSAYELVVAHSGPQDVIAMSSTLIAVDLGQ